MPLLLDRSHLCCVRMSRRICYAISKRNAKLEQLRNRASARPFAVRFAEEPQWVNVATGDHIADVKKLFKFLSRTPARHNSLDV
jgi:hypothetical protein